MREKQSLADLAVRQPLRRELGDLQLLRGQLIARLGRAAAAALARRAQLAPRLLAPRRAPERVEGVARGPQDGARLGDPAVAPQPLAVGELDPARAGTATVSGRRASASSKRSPASAGSATSARAWRRPSAIQVPGRLADARLDLRHPRARRRRAGRCGARPRRDPRSATMRSPGGRRSRPGRTAAQRMRTRRRGGRRRARPAPSRTGRTPS